MNPAVPDGTGTHTAQAPDNAQEIWRYREPSQPAFDPVVFDAAALKQQGLVTGIPQAGRGGTVFFELDGVPLVLREYRRGGLIRHISTRSYVQFGLERSRAMREFAVLMALEAMDLPAPVVFAARRTQHGLLETGELVTHRLDGMSLAEQIDAGDITRLADIGRCIARFHAHGVEHADLNVHNILVSDKKVHLLDFDRGRIHKAAKITHTTRWARNNIDRLLRSLSRIGAIPAGLVIQSVWRESLDSINALT